MSGSNISSAICKSAPRSRHITMPAPHHSIFYRPDALPAAQLSELVCQVILCFICVRKSADLSPRKGGQWRYSLQEALQMQRDYMTCQKYEILHTKRLAMGDDFQGHSRSLQLLLLDRPYTSITSC